MASGSLAASNIRPVSLLGFFLPLTRTYNPPYLKPAVTVTPREVQSYPYPARLSGTNTLDMSKKKTISTQKPLINAPTQRYIHTRYINTHGVTHKKTC